MEAKEFEPLGAKVIDLGGLDKSRAASKLSERSHFGAREGVQSSGCRCQPHVWDNFVGMLSRYAR